jgi:hypothetical protein
MLRIAINGNKPLSPNGNKPCFARGFCDAADLDRRVNQLIDAKLSSHSSPPNNGPHVPPPPHEHPHPPPPPSPSRFKGFKDFVKKRPFLLLGIGVAASAYVYWRVFPHHAKKILGRNSGGVQENLIIKREIDDVHSYRYSVTKAVEGEVSSEMYAKSMNSTLQHSLARLDLSSEQHTMLTQLGASYDVKNKAVVAQLLDVVRNAQVLDAIRQGRSKDSEATGKAADNKQPHSFDM